MLLPEVGIVLQKQYSLKQQVNMIIIQ